MSVRSHRTPPKRVHTVTSLTHTLRTFIRGSHTFEDIWVQGEVSELKRAASGHAYLTLKDESAVLPCVVWRRVFLTLQDVLDVGKKVFLRGRVDIYAERGMYQFHVEDARPLGKGDLHLRFEELKRRLSEEGLFDRERPIKRFPRRIGVVTSPSGAVIHDIIESMERRFPLVEVVIVPARVQGEGAAREIAAAIRRLDALSDTVDVIILARGGGSIEDLWPFNEEVVARAIYASRIPVVSAVGHEMDMTIADLVADRRAGTPSKAAEVILPDRRDILGEIDTFLTSIVRLTERAVSVRTSDLDLILDMWRSPDSILAGREMLLSDLTDSLIDSASNTIARMNGDLEVCERTLSALDPERTLARGYAVVSSGGSYISSLSGTAVGEEVTIRMHDGEADAGVTRIRRRSHDG